MANRDREELRRLDEYAAAKRREADEIFARVAARLDERRVAAEERRQRRRRIVRRLTFGRIA